MSGSALIDLQIMASHENEVRARVPVTDGLKQPLGLVHGGVYAVIADMLTTRGGRAISNQTSFLRPVTGGTINANERRPHGGRRTAVWEIDITDERDRLCALPRMTVAQRAPGPSQASAHSRSCGSPGP